MKVKLVVLGGGLVGYFETVPFMRLPEVLVWGERLFRWDPFATGEPFGVHTYVEACPFVLFGQPAATADEAKLAMP